MYPTFQWNNKDKLIVIELFAGIGAQKKALTNRGINHEIMAISEIDKEALVSYAIMHCNLNGIIKDYPFPSFEVMKNHLITKGVGFDFVTHQQTITEKTRLSKLRLYYLSDILSMNLGDVSKIQGDALPKCDLLTYSFPCTDISVAGKRKGFEKGTGTRSGLLWQVERILNEMNALPKILLMENVPAIVNKLHFKTFIKWIHELDKYGYKSYYSILNSKDYGIPQNRQRCYMISVLGDYSYQFPKPIKSNKYICDFIDNDVDPDLYIDNEITQLVTTKPIVIDYRNRKKVGCLNKKVKGKKVSQWNRIIHQDFLLPTITTREAPMIYLTGSNKVRRLSAKECMRFMGFNDEDYEKIHKHVYDSSIYRQCGNSIVVPVLEHIFASLIG